MRILPYLAVVTFVAGVVMLVFGYMNSGNSQAQTEDITFFTPTPAPPTAVPTVPPTDVPSPTPTPPPYGGGVARLKIPRFNVDSAIETIGIKSNNELDVPHDARNTGWYDTDLKKDGPFLGTKPGFGGNALFSAHVDYYGLPASATPFNKLKLVNPDDEVVVVMDNGLEYRYRVISKQRYSLSEIKMGEIIEANDKPEGKEWITLITCGNDGPFVRLTPGGNSGPVEYLTRDVVIAERIPSP